MDNSKRKKTNPIKSCRTINHSKNSLFKPKLNDENEIISSALNTTLTSKVNVFSLFITKSIYKKRNGYSYY